MKRVYIILFILFALIVLTIVYMRRALPCTVLESQSWNGVTVEIVDNACSEGLPHTRDASTIVMPLDTWTSSHRDETLRHELVHIRQRQHSEAWYVFYETEWKYRRSRLPPELDPNTIRPNPDTADSPYMLWADRYMFLPVYSADKTLRNAIVKVYDIQTRTFVSVPPEWTAFFSNTVRQYEHPHEISAEYLTLQKDTPASKKLVRFYENFSS